MLSFLLNLIFPKKCVSCGRWDTFLCPNCQKKIEYFTVQVCPYCERPSPYGFTHPRCQKALGLDGMFVLAHYRGPIRQALKSIKYQGAYGIAQELSGLVTSQYHRQYRFRYFVPVPLAVKRERERGFNQAEKLAGGLSKNLGNTPVINILARILETKPQFDLKMKERKTNIFGAFALSLQLKTTDLSKYSFCLVDDVATTGATIFECAKVLKRAGAPKVYAICVARGG